MASQIAALNSSTLSPVQLDTGRSDKRTEAIRRRSSENTAAVLVHRQQQAAGRARYQVPGTYVRYQVPGL